MSPADEHRGARERILKAAATLFAERGYDAVSVADIAQASGISTGLVYYHFKDKRTLYETSIREGLHLFEDAGVRALSGEAPADEKVRGFVQEYMALLEEHAAIMRMLVRGVSDLTAPAPRHMLMRSAAAIDRLEGVIADGIAQGVFRQVDARLAALSLFALVNTPMTARALESTLSGAAVHMPASEQATFVAELFLRGVSSCS